MGECPYCVKNPLAVVERLCENADLRTQLAESQAELDRWRDDHLEQERVIDGLSEQLAESHQKGKDNEQS